VDRYDAEHLNLSAMSGSLQQLTNSHSGSYFPQMAAVICWIYIVWQFTATNKLT